MRNDEYIWKLISRCVFGEASHEEIQQLQQLLSEDPSLQQQYDLMNQVFKSREHSVKIADRNYEQQALNLLDKAEKLRANTVSESASPGRKKVRYWLAAASFIGVAGIAGSVFYLVNTQNINRKIAGTTRNGERKSLVLADGTRVWLNAGSKLNYLSGFGSATREVELEGEAYFDVVENKSKPFVVHAENVLIKVLGTAFNVKAYEEDGTVTTSLYRGLVNITRSEDGQKSQPILLNPHQKLIVPVEVQKPEGQAVPQKEFSAVKVEFLDSTQSESGRIGTSWVYNRLEFRGDDFVTLAHKLEHWFNIKINFEDEQVQQLSFNGSFEKETIEQALKALQLANPFNYKIKSNEIFISTAP